MEYNFKMGTTSRDNRLTFSHIAVELKVKNIFEYRLLLDDVVQVFQTL